MKHSRCVIFGGTGFIGSHLARLLLNKGYCSQIILADIVKPDLQRFGYFLTDFIESGEVSYIPCDVRDILSFDNLPDSGAQLIINLAAVHREPGHLAYEYYETNILGAENVCDWAERVECEKVVFTSSIAPYGPCEDGKDEESIPCPETPYGSSKLAAEKIHIGWQKTDLTTRNLVIVRPGVVFGPGEGGNVTRLVRAVLGRYFFHMGNKGTVKAGIYVKELCYSILWALDNVENSEGGWLLYNATMRPAPSVEEYVNSICKVASVKRYILSVPYFLLYSISFLIEAVARVFGIQQPFSPVRIKKLVRSNNIHAKVLSDLGYKYQFSLESAFIDWKADHPKDWT